MNKPMREFRADRHPAESYEDILDRDTREVPLIMREGPVPDIGTEPIAASRYTSREFFEREVARVWLKTWQMACREEDIPNPGDYTIYDLVDKSLIVTRSPSGDIKAFYNSCLHRGRKLVTLNGCKSEFRCPFHGMTWTGDGAFKENPIEWDFPQWQGSGPRLPEAKVGTWAGFVFVNFDREAAPLDETLGPIVGHFTRWRLDDSYTVAHVGKIIRANWKVVAEAFMESHHSVTTHPQILPFIADVNSQYDILSDYITRQFSAIGVVSPYLAGQTVTPTDSYRAMVMQGGGMGAYEASSLVVPEGETARAYAAEQARQALSSEDGHDYSQCSDAEMVDSLLYNVWPNMSFWAGHTQKFIYRWRPNGRDHESTLMEVWILKRVPKNRPRPAPTAFRMLSDDEAWTTAEELGGLAAVFDQDMSNLQFVQEGLHSSGTGLVNFGRYSEMRIRKLHHMLDRYMNN